MRSPRYADNLSLVASTGWNKIVATQPTSCTVAYLYIFILLQDS